MTIAFIFDEDFRGFEGLSGYRIRDVIFASGILQNSGRHLKISIGSLIVAPIGFGNNKPVSRDEVIVRYARILSHPTKNELKKMLLAEAANRGALFSWVIQNIDSATCDRLHRMFKSSAGYLGYQEPDFAYGPHLAVYRNSMVTHYRVFGRQCNIFYTMNNIEEAETGEAEYLVSKGFFDKVELEDYGARGTVFDDFDTLELHQGIKQFHGLLSGIFSDAPDDADEMIMLLEEYSPRLFITLVSATNTFLRARNIEDFAQVAASLRRYLEQLSDVLFPARKGKVYEMEVGRAQHKNRILAFMKENWKGDDLEFDMLTKEVFRLFDEVNAVLHSDQVKERLEKCLTDLVKFTLRLLNLQAPGSADAYAPYQAFVDRFIASWKGKVDTNN